MTTTLLDMGRNPSKLMMYSENPKFILVVWNEPNADNQPVEQGHVT